MVNKTIKTFDGSFVTKEKANFDFNENKFALYAFIFYAFGLFIGSFFYKIARTDTLDNLLKFEKQSFLNLFISNFSIYFSVFVLVMFLGFCLIGYPLLNIIPTVIGFVTGIRISYYYLAYSVKGIGYSLIMIIPFISLFITVIAYTIKTSTALSQNIYCLTKGEEVKKFEMTPYLKQYLIYSVLVVIVALVDAGLTALLFSIITI